MSFFERAKPTGYACAPNGEKRYTWPAGGEWPTPGYNLSGRHVHLPIEDIDLAIECANDMEKKYVRAFNTSGFSHYEVYACMLDRLLKKEENIIDGKTRYYHNERVLKYTEEQKRALFKNEFHRMVARGFSFDYMKGTEIPISQLDEHTERKVNNLLYSS